MLPRLLPVMEGPCAPHQDGCTNPAFGPLGLSVARNLGHCERFFCLMQQKCCYCLYYRVIVATRVLDTLASPTCAKVFTDTEAVGTYGAKGYLQKAAESND